MKFEAIEKAWLTHAYDGFPRKVGTPTQKIIHTQEDFLMYVWSMVGRTNIYTALFSELTKETENYFRLYFDIDFEDNLTKAYDDMRITVKWFEKELNITPTVYFTGKKGFAIYVYFKPMKFREYQYTCRAIADSIGVNSFDFTVVGNTPQISRLPFTRHMGSNRYCLPIDTNWSFDKILKYSFRWPNKLDIVVNIDMASGITDWIKKYEERGIAKKEKHMERVGDGKDYGWDLNAIMKLAPKLVGGRRTLMYRVIIPKMWQDGLSYHDILEYTKQFIDRSGSNLTNIERLVTRHLSYTQQGKSLLWSQQAYFQAEPWAWSVFKDG